MNKTKIEWCDSTWNPVTGCYHTCPYCYARVMAKRFGGWEVTSEMKKYIHPAKAYYEIEETNFGVIVDANNPFTKKDGKKAPYPFGFIPTFHRYRLDEPQQKTKPQTIFVCSMADLFGEWVPDSWIENVFEVCKKAPQHRYLFLTKNPQRYIDLSEAGKLPTKDNMWYGTTVTTPYEFFFWSKERHTHTFVSIEPIMEDFSDEIMTNHDLCVEWVIAGAETGNRKDKVIPKKEWIDAIAKKCDSSNIRLFLKDSMIPIVGDKNMRREFPWERTD